ncbi:hypothetical protein CARUB_v10002314mg [Capsella rubella]|uniref:Reticulon domain-containing protein n=1 Tax=Capsella rubella TaxID=81985 RepID=R0HDM3_9BRAS|nr:hypothetical protein CARUB_v10002314mg [Capsella rubella]
MVEDHKHEESILEKPVHKVLGAADIFLWRNKKVSGGFFWFYCLFPATVLLFTIPVIYEKYEDKVDAFGGEKAMKEIKKQYAVLDEKVLSKVLSKIPRGALNKKKD